MTHRAWIGEPCDFLAGSWTRTLMWHHAGECVALVAESLKARLRAGGHFPLLQTTTEIVTVRLESAVRRGPRGQRVIALTSWRAEDRRREEEQRALGCAVRWRPGSTQRPTLP
jgi:hypothetical protein